MPNEAPSQCAVDDSLPVKKKQMEMEVILFPRHQRGEKYNFHLV
jgi:hypothetical protein